MNIEIIFLAECKPTSLANEWFNTIMYNRLMHIQVTLHSKCLIAPQVIAFKWSFVRMSSQMDEELALAEYRVITFVLPCLIEFTNEKQRFLLLFICC
jgi:hypothetical protein